MRAGVHAHACLRGRSERISKQQLLWGAAAPFLPPSLTFAFEGELTCDKKGGLQTWHRERREQKRGRLSGFMLNRFLNNSLFPAGKRQASEGL